MLSYKLIIAFLAVPGALAIPFIPPQHNINTQDSSEPNTKLITRFVPPSHDSSNSEKVARFVPPVHITPPSSPKITTRSPGSFKVDIRHRLSEDGELYKRSGTASVDTAFSTYWIATSRAGGQEVDMLVDTGSADLWIVGPDADVAQQSVVKTYDPSSSKSVNRMRGLSFSISYGDGKNSVSGPVFQDSFSMGSALVEGMPIGSAQQIEGIDPGTFKSGILGMGFIGGNSVKPHPQPTFMEALMPGLAEPVFVCNFKMGGGGSLEFGSIDKSLFQGDLTTIRADNESKYPASWSAEEVRYVSNGKVLGTFDIVFDTGGPSTSGPKEIVDAYYAQIPGAKDISPSQDGSVMTVPCDTEMPELEFHFRNGAVAKIPGQNLIKGPFALDQCVTWFGRENSVNRGLVGDAFFNSNVVVFDQSQATISWAPQVGQ